MAYWKKIKNTNAVPVLKDELVFDQTPTVNSTNPVTSDGVARAIAGASGEVPVVTENDNGKVLKAIYDAGGPAVEWAEQTIPTVDQNYSASSVNAQSGVAVAQAIAAIPSATYTAGDGIDIDAQNAVSVKAGNGLSIGNATSSETVSLTTSAYYYSPTTSSYYVGDICPLTNSLLGSINDSGLALKLSLSGNYIGYIPNVSVYACLYNYASEASTGVTIDKRLVLGSPIPLNDGYLSAGTEVTFDGGSVNAELSNTTMSDLIADMSSHTYHIGFWVTSDYWGSFVNNFPLGSQPSGPTTTATYTGTVTIHDALNVSNPVPTPASDAAGKVLTVTDTSGHYGWQPVPQELPPVATNAGKVLTVNSGATGVEWATPSGVTKQEISLTGATTSQDATNTTFTFNLASANQFYALGKLVSVSYKARYYPNVDVSGVKIKISYGTHVSEIITLDAIITGGANIYSASVFVGNEAEISYASDPTLGYKFNKVEIVVPVLDWTSSTEADSLKIQILG